MTTKFLFIYFVLVLVAMLTAFSSGLISNRYTLWIAIWAGLGAIALPVIYYFIFR